MEPLAAIGLASNILQMVDFTKKLISQTREIHTSTTGALDIHEGLQASSRNLSELTSSIQGKSSILKFVPSKNFHKSTPERRLWILCQETEDITNDIQNAIERISGDTTTIWKSTRQAFRSIRSEKEMEALKERLDRIYQEVNSAILFSIRERMDGTDWRGKLSQNLDLSDPAAARHLQLLEAINKNRWHSRNDTHVRCFSEAISSVSRSDAESRFYRAILTRIKFPGMPDRHESIPEAFQTTFQWIFNPSKISSQGERWDNFSTWLGRRKDSNVYWITGKPGSGKSTLMKYLYNEPHTRQFLQSWVQKKPLITAGFFFWNSGTDMQMSQMGLMQTLLYESLQRISAQENSQEIFKNLLADRWDEYEAFGGGIHPFTLSEIYRVFDRLLSDVSRCFFLVIDGLDEFDGNSRDLIRLIMSMSRHGNVKICTASRPWLVFEDAFSNRPNLLLEQLTEEDIRLYITSNFNQNAHFVSLMRYESLFAHALIANVVTKAQGVFLWVYLVVESLLEGISNADRMSDLQSRLDSLPSDLEDLFDKLLGRLDQIYFAQACQFFLLLKEHPSPSLLQLSFADDDDTTSSMKANVQPLRPEEALIRMRVTSRRLRSRCKGLLEVYYEGSGETRIKVSREALNSHFKLMKTDRDSPQDLTSFKVGYLHRTARDYLHSPRVWEIICEATANTSFDAQESWANCFLWCLKTIRPIDNISSVKWELWDPLSWCMEYALRLQERDGKTRLTYLDEVSKAFEQDRESVYRRGQLLETTYDAPRESFVSVAAALSFNDYVRVKLKTMSRAERKGFSKSRLNRLIRDAYTANSQLPGRQKLWHKIQCQIILGSNKDVEYYRRSSWRRAIMLKPNGKPVEFV